MKTWPFAAVGLICLTLAGCRTDPGVTLLERQNRLLEDEVYRLRGEIQDFEEGGTPVNSASGKSVDTTSAAGETRINQESGPAPGKTSASRRKKSTQQESVTPLMIEPGEALPPGKIPDILNPGKKAPGEPGNLNIPEVPKQIEGPSGPNLPGPQGIDGSGSNKTSQLRSNVGFESVAKADSKDVGQLVLNRMLTGGFSEEGRSGDSGVLVVIEPRDANGRRLEAPGDVAIVLLDPSKTGKEAKLARWDFLAAETAKLFRGSGVGRGMYVECPWPDHPPENNRLHLFVRYTTRDGRKLQADQAVEVSLPGERVSRWTPSASDVQPAYATEGQYESNQSGVENASAQSEASDSPADDAQSPRRTRSLRTASRSNSAKLQRPTWSPERF